MSSTGRNWRAVSRKSCSRSTWCAISTRRRSPTMSSCWTIARSPPFPAGGSRSGVLRSVSLTRFWHACERNSHDRSTTRWVLNPVMPYSSNRGACFSRRRPSMPPLKASDGRFARNPSKPCGRAATPAGDAGARDPVDRHSRRLWRRRADRATYRLERRHGTQRLPFRSGPPLRSISTSTMSARSRRSAWTRIGRGWRIGLSG